MRVAIYGLTHLGLVTAACSAEHFDAIAIGTPSSVDEPHLDELLTRVEFTTDIAAARGADIVWVCFDTPVDEHDNSDVASVFSSIAEVCRHVGPETLVLVSSQLPVGSCAELERLHPKHRFAISPENLRRGNAVNDFRKMNRVIIGSRARIPLLDTLFAPFADEVLWMSPESAEMVKHALNGFLAVSICYANELGDICANVGADMNDVTRGLRSDPRIGPRAYLRAGEAYTGGTLGRDVVTLSTIGDGPLIGAIKPSNDRHL
jgi:UDPglucose 6-dehydrogenase